MPEGRRDEIEAVAAEWVSRLSGDPLRPDERRDLSHWLARHPDHQAAFDFARTVWSDLGALRDAPGSLANDFVPPRPEADRQSTRASTGWQPRRLVWAGSLAACLTIAVGLGAFWFGDPVTAFLADYRTAPAETRSVVLSDGSALELAPASAMALRFDGNERRVELLSGALYVTAAPMDQNERRPFVVAAADGAAKALGTQYMVERQADAVQVTVALHRVEVAVAGAAAPADAVTLTSGQSVRYDGRGGLGPVHGVALETATAWRRGRLIFDRAPLAEVVARLNRYRRGEIIIADAELAERRVSGVFETTRLDNALDSIAQELGAEQIAVPPFITLLY